MHPIIKPKIYVEMDTTSTQYNQFFSLNAGCCSTLRFLVNISINNIAATNPKHIHHNPYNTHKLMLAIVMADIAETICGMKYILPPVTLGFNVITPNRNATKALHQHCPINRMQNEAPNINT